MGVHVVDCQAIPGGFAIESDSGGYLQRQAPQKGSGRLHRGRQIQAGPCQIAE
jgi:hypothetical protein